jgi:hypothetical protein
MDLYLEFYTLFRAPYLRDPRISWRLRDGKDGPVVAYGAKDWETLAQARKAAGLLIKELQWDRFYVRDITRSKAAKTQAAPCKSRALPSKAGK